MSPEKAFIKLFDEGKDIVKPGRWNDGSISNELEELVDSEHFYADEGILYCGFEIVEDKLIGNGDHHVERRAILKIDSRFFAVNYDGIGKDLDEYVGFSIGEVYPRTITTVVYE